MFSRYEFDFDEEMDKDPDPFFLEIGLSYETLTEEQLEEWVELIDWSLLPSKLLTENIVTLFGSNPELQKRLEAEEYIWKMFMYNEYGIRS